MTVRYELDLTTGDDPELVAARLWVAGAVGVQELPSRLVGWFDVRAADVPPGGSWHPEPDRDWLAAWREGIEPVRAGRIHVVPTWLDDTHPSGPDDVRVVLDPGIAFGTGHHTTTRLCLEELQGAMAPGARVLDVGCGTGILAIAAVLLGADEVEAVDVDGDAVLATRRNAAANGVAVTVRVGSVEAASGPADVVVANLLTPVLHDLGSDLVALVRPGGTLIASGVAPARAASVMAGLRDAGAVPVRRRDEDDWSVLLLTVPEPGS